MVRAQAEEQELKNQEMQLKMMQLALDMVEKVNPEMSAEQKMLYAVKIIDPTSLIAMSPLEITEIVVSEAAGTEAETDGDEGDATK